MTPTSPPPSPLASPSEARPRPDLRSSPAALAADAGFHTTRWSVVLAAQDPGSPQAHQALSELCQVYWYPLYVFIRRRGNGHAEAEDLTQAFFARLLEKDGIAEVTREGGRFRCFLLTSLKNFLANQWHRAQAQKRGGGKVIHSLDEDEADSRYAAEAVEHVTPESLYERRWALTLLACVLERLRSEFVSSEKVALFEELKGFLSAPGEEELPYAAVAQRTGLKEGTVRVAVHRLRRRYGELLRAEIAQTVADPAEIEDELRCLVRALAG